VIPVGEIQTGHRGQPWKTFDWDWMKDATSAHRNISMNALSKALGIHQNTLRNHLRMHGIYQNFSAITEPEIDTLIRHLKEKPTTGIRYVIGYFRQNGIQIQRWQIWMSFYRMDQLGQTLQNWDVIKHQKYKVPWPNYLWHMDGHHKLIRWGIVIHGIIDGCCWTVRTQNSLLYLFLI